ncbi:MAG: uroporphyrinogen decarboxylase family protein [Rectinemataceae bacterium]
MTKLQRVRAALRGEPTDRVPFSVYQHSNVHNRGAGQFAEYTLAFHKKYDPDYVKVMYDENYDSPVNFQFAVDPKVWGLLEELDPRQGAFGRQMESLKIIKDSVGPDVPVVQTLYSPFHWGVRLAWRQIMAHYREEPELVERGLAVIAKNIIAFGLLALQEAGIDGFLFGAYGCEPSWLGEAEYGHIAMRHDKSVLAALRKGSILMLHIHGEQGSYFDLLKDYECDALSWEDRLGGPSLAEARKRSAKCLIGGVDHVKAATRSKEEVLAEARDAIRQTGGRGFILAPGCTFGDEVKEDRILALREAAESSRSRG